VCVILILMWPFIYFRGCHRAARSQLLNLDVWPRDTREPAAWISSSALYLHTFMPRIKLIAFAMRLEKCIRRVSVCVCVCIKMFVGV
jgi:hypothetical protein